MLKSDGAIIFDKVKVVSSLMWNSRNHKIIGLAMTEEDQALLHDVFQLFGKDNRITQTKYMLQFLWRDVTSSFNTVGPYYASEDSMNGKFICSCVLETIRLLHASRLHSNNICTKSKLM